MYTIKILFQDAKEPVLLEGIKAEESLLEVCRANNIELGHECGGICSCTTCCVYVAKGNELLAPASKRENDVLAKKGKSTVMSRLGCQSLLLEGSGEIEIMIPVQQRT